MDRIEVTEELFHALREGAVAVVSDASLFEVSGPGAGACLQGLHTNEVERRGSDALVYGAFLTPKGMIVADYWAARSESDYLLFGDLPGRADTLELFRRRLPPRLAKATDRSDDWAILYLLGPEAWEVGETVLASPGGQVTLPAEGRVVRAVDGPAWIGRAPAGAPFGMAAVAPRAAIDRWAEAARARGARRAGAEGLRAARVLAGAPTLGAEIGERTLPQEVRFDELDGVSYEKGCYVGQETVARIHFRGHPNWLLRGLRIERGDTPPPGATEPGVRSGEKDVGRITTALLRPAGPPIALAILRREVEPGATVDTALGSARVAELPFG